MAVKINPKLKKIVNAKSTRVAVVGTHKSGKTIFLTSLLAHMENHDPNKLELKKGKKGKQLEIVNFEKCKATSPGFKSFPYDNIRSNLIHRGKWPGKTRATYQFRCKIELREESRKKRDKRYLEFLDFPGERTADFSMHTQSYAEWSDTLLESIEANVHYRELAREFTDLLESATADERSLIHKYKLFLAEAFIQRYSRIVTPSVFLLDQKSKSPDKNKTSTQWAEERCCGLNKEEEFVPLSSEFRQKNQEIAKKFEQNYQRYKKQIVKPVLKWLTEADQLLLIEDIPDILMSGPSGYNDEKSIAQRTLKLTDWKSFWKDLFHVGCIGGIILWPKRIKRIGVVATKADLVATDEDMDNMKSLVRKMTHKTLKGLNLPGKDMQCFSCAPVKSTERIDDSGMIIGRLAFDEDLHKKSSKEPPEKFYPSVVPSHWPRDEDWSDYNFPEVYPSISKVRDQPPDQTGLEKIMKYILEL